MSRSEKEEIVELLLRLTAEDLSGPDELQRLDTLLSDPELASEAVALLDVQAGLRDAQQGECSQVEHTPRSIPAPHKPRLPLGLGNDGPLATTSFTRFALFAAAILIASNLLVGSIVWFSASQPVADIVRPSDQRQESPKLRQPQLVSMTACVWSPTEIAPAIGYSIPKGKSLHLLEGIAEMDFGQGDSNRARVRMEGPGNILTQPDGSLSLNFGALTADVSWHDGPFSIDIPAGRVVIHGSASIGVVANDPQNEVHVFQGDARVELFSSGDPNSSVQLGPGEAASLVMSRQGDANVTLSNASSGSFASARTMAFDRLRIGQSYRDMIVQADPAIYWQFENSVDNQVINHGNLEGFNAYIDGAVSWRQFKDNRAAEFGLTGTIGSFLSRKTWPEKPLDSYTVEMWVKPSHFHNGALISLVEPKPLSVGGRYPQGMFLEIGGEFDRKSKRPALKDVRFVHRPVPSVNRLVGTSVKVKGGYRVRTWQHVVARKDGENLELIIDGRVAAQEKNAGPLASNLQIVIGQLFPKLTVRPFVGQIDEVAIYERALTDEEIVRHFEMAKPAVPFADERAGDSM